jgi:hypothetical protein
MHGFPKEEEKKKMIHVSIISLLYRFLADETGIKNKKLTEHDFFPFHNFVSKMDP